MKFSIIIPVYNATKYLRPCLDSVLSQTERDWECVCVDDGSTDGSAAILDEYAAKESDFVVVHGRKAGVSVARNKGLDIAKGEYVCFVDADDVVEKNWLKYYDEAITAYAPDVVRIRRPWWTDEPRSIDNDRDLKEWCWGAFVKEGYPWTYAVRREVARKAQFPAGVAMSEDQLYAAKLVPHIHSAVQLGTCGYEHLLHACSAMFTPLRSDERWRYMKALSEIVKADPHVDKRRVSAMCAACIMSWLNRYGDGDRRQDIREIWLELKENGCAEVSAEKVLFRVPYWLYARTGWLWPGRLWSKCVRVMVTLKKVIKYQRKSGE